MKLRCLHKLIYCLLLSLLTAPCRGQVSQYMFRDGTRDKTGNLWFATIGGGVYRYDAVSRALTNLTKRDGLWSDSVSAVVADRAGNVWFSTEAGVCRYDGKTFTKLVPKERLCHFGAELLLEDRNGDFWFGTNGCGVYRYNPGAGTQRVSGRSEPAPSAATTAAKRQGFDNLNKP